MEIGGYLGLEMLPSHPYYEELHALNLGRTALTYLLKALKCKTLFVPYFLCDSVTQKCEQEGITLSYYYINEELRPLVKSPLPAGSYLLLVNHYGQLTDDKIMAFKKQYENIIVDHTHSFFQRPLAGIHTLYSCRKFFGISDGAYLSSDIPLPPLALQDKSKDRMGHILGRFEGQARDYYQTLHENVDKFAQEPVKRMSALTANILGAIDYDDVRNKRNENYRTLDLRLGAYNTLPFIVPDGPLAYPFFLPDGISARQTLAAQSIYVPTYWSNVIEIMEEDRVEYQYAANILALPVDQRYDEKAMNIVADAVLAL